MSEHINEDLRTFLSSLPENGIGIHGTSLAYAQSIAEVGFRGIDRNLLNHPLYDSSSYDDNGEFHKFDVTGVGGSYFFYFDPKSEIRSLTETMRSFRQAIRGAWSYGNGHEIARVPAIVVLVPLKKPFFSPGDLTKSKQGLVVTAYEHEAIPCDRILGIIEPALSEEGKRYLQYKPYGPIMTDTKIPDKQPTSIITTISKSLLTPTRLSMTPTVTQTSNVPTYNFHSKYSNAEAHRILLEIGRLANLANV